MFHDLKMHKESHDRLKKEKKHEFQESGVDLETVDDITEEDYVTLKESSSDNYCDEETADVFVTNLCCICLLSFKSEHHLKEHMHKHSAVKLLPSILKKN